MSTDSKPRDTAEDLKQRKIKLLPTIKDDAPEQDLERAFLGGDATAPVEDRPADVVRADVIDAIKTVFDPEIPLNVYDLGLIYSVEVTDDRYVDIDMTLTAPACPVAGMLVQQVADKSGNVPGVRQSRVKLVWDPQWTRERMSEEAMLELGLL